MPSATERRAVAPLGRARIRLTKPPPATLHPGALTPNGDRLAALLYALGKTGAPGRELGTRLDLVRSAGLRYSWNRFRTQKLLAAIQRAHRDAVYRRIWGEAAAELGAEVTELSAGFLEIRGPRSRTRLWQQLVMLDDAVTLRLALDKRLVHTLLASAGLPVSEHVEFSSRNLAPALAFLRASPGPCVVKPANGTGGGASTTGAVRTPADLMRAALRGARKETRLLVERQAPGDVYRLLYLDGELLDVVRRLPPHVTGDGGASIEALVAAEVRRRIEAAGDVALELLAVDLDAILTLRSVGLRPASILPAGASVAVKTVTNHNRPEENETVRTPIAASLEAEGREAASLVGVRLAGVDLITHDLSTSLAESGGVIIEVNGTPGLHHHYRVADRKRATRVAVPVLRALLD